MSDDLKKILSNLNNNIEQEKLLEYLNRQLTEEEQHDLEAQMNDDEFMSDALDGLEQMNDKTVVPLIVKELNSGLKKQLVVIQTFNSSICNNCSTDLSSFLSTNQSQRRKSSVEFGCRNTNGLSVFTETKRISLAR